MASTTTLTAPSNSYFDTVGLFPGVGYISSFNSVSASGTSATVTFSYSDPSYVLTLTGSNLATIAGGTDIAGTITGMSVALASAPGVPLAVWSSGAGVTISSLLTSTDKTFLTGGDVINGGAANENIYAGVGGGTQIAGGGGNDNYTFNAGHNFTGDVITDSVAGGQTNELYFLASDAASLPPGFVVNYDLRSAASITGINSILLNGRSGQVAVKIGSNQIGSGLIESDFEFAATAAELSLTVVDSAPGTASVIDLSGVQMLSYAYRSDASTSLTIDASAATASKFLYAPTINQDPITVYLISGSGSDQLTGGTGVDNLISGVGADTLISGANDDLLNGGAGNDTINGGAGIDTAFYSFATNSVTVTLSNLVNGSTGGSSSGADGIDTLIDIENIAGSFYADVLTGNNQANVLIGGAGVDQVFGGAGNDTIYWDPSDDLANVLGGGNTDTLVYTSGSAPTSFNLVSHQFERAEGRIADTGANAWTSYVDNYDSAWRETHQTGLMDDGRTYNEDYDELGNQSWVRITYWNDSYGRTDVETGQLDDGRVYDSDIDNFGLYPWTRIDYWRDALGRSDVETGFLDDGRTYNSDLDNGDAFAWFRIDNWADSLGRLDYQNGKYDADDPTRPNWSWQVDYDQADQFAWSRVERFYDAAGLLQSENFFN